MNEQPVSHGEATPCYSTIDEVRATDNIAVEVSSDCLYFAMVAKVQRESHQLLLVFSEDRNSCKQLGNAYTLCHTDDEIIELKVGNCKTIWVLVFSDKQGKYIILQRNSPISKEMFLDRPHVLREEFTIRVDHKPPSSFSEKIRRGFIWPFKLLFRQSEDSDDKLIKKVPWCILLPKYYGEGVLMVDLPSKELSLKMLNFTVEVGQPEQASQVTATDGPEGADSIHHPPCQPEETLTLNFSGNLLRVIDRLSKRFEGMGLCDSLATHLEVRADFVQEFRGQDSSHQVNYPGIAKAIMMEWAKNQRVSPGERLGILYKVLRDDLERKDFAEECLKLGKHYSDMTES